VFIHGSSIDQATFDPAKSEGCAVYAEFATLNGRVGDWIEMNPDAHPIDDTGNPANPATWFMDVCPTNAGFREYRMDTLSSMPESLALDGIWMDYLHWHAQFEDPCPVFIKTCCCDACLRSFQSWADIEVAGDEVSEKAKWIFMNAARAWEDWRVSVIVDWAKELRSRVTSIRPDAKVGAFHCAWKDEDLGGVRRRCLGLDFEALSTQVDVFSPMIYHGRSGKTPEYVSEFVDYFGERYIRAGKDTELWPIVQAHDEPYISPEEFEQVLRYGLSGKSTGVMMFTIRSVAESKGKLAAMKRVYVGHND
jgi:hypothetical protein